MLSTGLNAYAPCTGNANTHTQPAADRPQCQRHELAEPVGHQPQQSNGHGGAACPGPQGPALRGDPALHGGETWPLGGTVTA